MGVVSVNIIFKSNLELHVDVLRNLACHGPLQSSNLKDKTKIDGSTLKKHLGFLVQNNLVEKQHTKKDRVLYAITERGQKLPSWFSQFNDDLKLEVHAPT